MEAISSATDVMRSAVAPMLARAFQDDPAFSYIFPDAKDRARRLPRLFRLLFDSDGRAGMRLMTAGCEATTMWRAPGCAKVGWGEMLAHAIPLVSALGGNVVRALRVGNAIDAHMPSGPFWYLHIAGCDPDQQGRGLGSAAIRGGLDRTGGTPVYLETATERNVALYQRLGFVVTGEWQVTGGGPRFWSMLRG